MSLNESVTLKKVNVINICGEGKRRGKKNAENNKLPNRMRKFNNNNSNINNTNDNQ